MDAKGMARDLSRNPAYVDGALVCAPIPDNRGGLRLLDESGATLLRVDGHRLSAGYVFDDGEADVARFDALAEAWTELVEEEPWTIGASSVAVHDVRAHLTRRVASISLDAVPQGGDEPEYVEVFARLDAFADPADVSRVVRDIVEAPTRPDEQDDTLPL